MQTTPIKSYSSQNQKKNLKNHLKNGEMLGRRKVYLDLEGHSKDDNGGECDKN